MNSLSYFLGSNTPKGFYSLFSELYNPFDNWNMYIIKGGPGTGKSSLMKKVASYAENNNYKTERIHCSSDPLSLDAVILPEIKVSIADGTSPHIINPVFPGVCEHTIELSNLWDKQKLKINSEKIKKITLQNSDNHKQCIKYLKAAGAINSELRNISDIIINKEKTDRFIKRFCEKYLIYTENQTGELKKRFLSTITPLGIVIEYDTIFNQSEKIITLKDDIGFISEYILNRINDYAKTKNIDRTVCFCPMNPKTKAEHIIFNNINLSIFTANFYHPMIKKTESNINCDRFINNNILSEYKNKIYFLKKAKLELIGESVKCLEKAKETHDILESYYISSMDFNGMSDITDKLINEIFNL